MFKPNMMMVKGNTTLDNKPVRTTIDVTTSDNKNYASLTSDSKDGHYLVNLEEGKNYKLTFQLVGSKDQIRTVEVALNSGYTVKIIDISFSIVDTTTKQVITDTIKKEGAPLVSTTATSDTTSIKKQPESEKPILSSSLGEASAEGLEFKVQIAAYNLPKNYRYQYLKGLGKIEQLKLSDGITRFTIGGVFTTLNAANAHRDKVRAAGQKDAFVTAIYKGKRVYLEDLEKMGILKGTVRH
jgi:hypothetical protein